MNQPRLSQVFSLAWTKGVSLVMKLPVLKGSNLMKMLLHFLWNVDFLKTIKKIATTKINGWKTRPLFWGKRPFWSVFAACFKECTCPQTNMDTQNDDLEKVAAVPQRWQQRIVGVLTMHGLDPAPEQALSSADWFFRFGLTDQMPGVVTRGESCRQSQDSASQQWQSRCMEGKVLGDSSWISTTATTIQGSAKLLGQGGRVWPKLWSHSWALQTSGFEQNTTVFSAYVDLWNWVFDFWWVCNNYIHAE